MRKKIRAEAPLLTIPKYLNDSFESCDVDRTCQAIRTVTKAYNISELARKSGIPREVIHRSFAGKGAYPNVTTAAAVLSAMGLEPIQEV
jgi:probable addiction module antidote protein